MIKHVNFTPKKCAKKGYKVLLMWEKTMYIYTNKDGNPSTKNTRHVKANVNIGKENQNN
jgi:hypothetical protein